MSHSASMSGPISPGKAVADGLVVSLNAKTAPAYATPVYSCGALPTVLDQVKSAIAGTPGTPVWDILLSAIRGDIVFRPQCVFAAGAWSDGREKVFRTMATGTTEYAFDLPPLNLTGWFADMFAGISKAHALTAIHEFDLFHGHVVPNEAGRDVVIIFHAKEYPTGTVNSYRMNDYRNNNLLTPSAKSFRLNDNVMDQRNFIWTLNTNTVFLLNGAIRLKDPSSDFYQLMIDIKRTDPLESDEVQAGTVQEKLFGPELFSVNYFPNQLAGDHTSQVFFTPVGSWGVLKNLETLYPTVAGADIATIYARLGESLAGSIKELNARTKTP